jgi:predicted RNase H-like HicB family nuclease
MTRYIAIVEKEQSKARGVWFPRSAGLFLGRRFEEATLNAQEALELWGEARLESSQTIPPQRSLTELKADSGIASNLNRFMVPLKLFRDSSCSRAAE